ncbi:hypothetical protein [Helicobacter valdiviensis]|nr:hypothetical protein [Helicobacter valdiviensis]
MAILFGLPRLLYRLAMTEKPSKISLPQLFMRLYNDDKEKFL